MENNSKKKNGHKCWLLCHCDKSWGNFLVKIFLALVLIAFGLVVLIVVFSELGGYNKLGHSGSRISKATCSMTNGLKGRCPISSLIDSTKLFGTVEKVEGNKITVKDNAANTQVIVTLVNTVIASSTGEVGLSDLKPGVNITAYGSYNNSKQLVAKMIKITQ